MSGRCRRVEGSKGPVKPRTEHKRLYVSSNFFKKSTSRVGMFFNIVLGLAISRRSSSKVNRSRKYLVERCDLKSSLEW